MVTSVALLYTSKYIQYDVPVPNIYDKDYPQVTAWCHTELSPTPSLDITVKTQLMGDTKTRHTAGQYHQSRGEIEKHRNLRSLQKIKQIWKYYVVLE